MKNDFCEDLSELGCSQPDTHDFLLYKNARDRIAIIFSTRGPYGEWREDKASSGQAAPPKVGESSRFALSPREPSTLIFVPFGLMGMREAAAESALRFVGVPPTPTHAHSAFAVCRAKPGRVTPLQERTALSL